MSSLYLSSPGTSDSQFFLFHFSVGITRKKRDPIKIWTVIPYTERSLVRTQIDISPKAIDRWPTNTLENSQNHHSVEKYKS